MRKRLIFATSNRHKLEEVRNILDGEFFIEGLDAIPFTGEIPETSATIEGNAIEKVEYIAGYTRHPVFAEDTGLIVPALGGDPGVFSARYAGEHKSDQDNISKLLRELNQPDVDRRAFFQTVLAFRDSAGRVNTFTGEVHGRIANAPRGDQGFGYDPVFVPNGFEETFSQLGDEVKNTVSHRRKALDKFRQFLLAHGPLG